MHLLIDVLTVGMCVVQITNNSFSFISFCPFSFVPILLFLLPSYRHSFLLQFHLSFTLIMFPLTIYCFRNFILRYVLFLLPYFFSWRHTTRFVFTITIPFPCLPVSSSTVKQFSKFCWLWGEHYSLSHASIVFTQVTVCFRLTCPLANICTCIIQFKFCVVLTLELRHFE